MNISFRFLKALFFYLLKLSSAIEKSDAILICLIRDFFFFFALSVEILRLFRLQCLDILWLCTLVWVFPCTEYLMYSFNEDKCSIFWYYFTDNYFPSVYCFFVCFVLFCLLYPVSFSWILFSQVLGCQDWSFVTDTLFSTFHFLVVWGFIFVVLFFWEIFLIITI